MIRCLILSLLVGIIIGVMIYLTQPPHLSRELISPNQLRLTIAERVKSIDAKPSIGTSVAERMKYDLDHTLADFRISTQEGSFAMDVECGDSIYHVTLKIEEGKVIEVTVTQTPICMSPY